MVAIENALTNHTFDHQISGKYYKYLNRNASGICAFDNEHPETLTLASCRTLAFYSQFITIIVVQLCVSYHTTSQGVLLPMYLVGSGSSVPTGRVAFGTRPCQTHKRAGRKLFGPAGCVAFGRLQCLYGTCWRCCLRSSYVRDNVYLHHQLVVVLQLKCRTKTVQFCVGMLEGSMMEQREQVYVI